MRSDTSTPLPDSFVGESAPSHPRNPSAAVAAAVIVSASFAMAATLPGRTHGLGLIRSRLLVDFSAIDDTALGVINLVATLVGSLLCIPCGRLIDRFGVRPVLLVVMLGLAATVVATSQIESALWLTVFITLSRGLGQSMLSVASIVLLSKWFRRDAGLPMAAYAVLMTLLLAAATGGLAERIVAVGWRSAWMEMGIVLAAITPVAWWLAFPGRPIRNFSERSHSVTESNGDTASATLLDALSSHSFWVFALGISLFSLVTSGVTLYQERILAERGLSESVYHAVLVFGFLIGLVANLIGGWLSRRISMTSILAIAMFMLTASLAALPLIRTTWQAYVQAAVACAAGGLLTVLFFAVWVEAFGPQHVGRIQGAAQMLTVLASAVGPLAVAWAREEFGSYMHIFVFLAAVSAMFGFAALRVSLPLAIRGDWARCEQERSVPCLQET
jgi:MFS family permease